MNENRQDPAPAVTEQGAKSDRPAKMPLRRSIGISVSIMGLGLALILGMVYLLQDRLIYPRTPDMGVPEGWAAVKLGEETQGLWLPGKPGAKTVLFFHGNATDTPGVLQATKAFQESGNAILVPSYPGYAGAPGTPGQESITKTAEDAMAWLANKGVSANRLVIYGNSIGSGPALHAAQRPHLALVIVSGIASLEDVARSHYGPMSMFLRDKWRNEDLIGKAPGHKIVVHGTADEVVPIEQGERLAQKAGVPLITLPGGHEIAFDEGLQKAIEASVDRRAKSAN